MRAPAGALALSWLVCSCQRAPAHEERAVAASAGPAGVPAPSASTPSARAWYEGRWSGSYESALERIELEVGGVRAWKDDDGKRGSGKGTLTVAVTPEGIASGEADGALGAQVVRGVADDQGFRLTLAPKADAADGFRGTVVLAKAPGVVSGSMHASSGDSLTVRKARVELQPSAP